MKLFYVLIILLVFQNCSFDNKTGIWENNNIPKESNDLFKEFKKVSTSEDVFNEIIPFTKNYKFRSLPPTKNLSWKDIFFQNNNNLINFEYNNSNNIIFKSKKLTRSKVNKDILFENGNLIISDESGNIIVYSIKKKKIIAKYNFYKKKYKKIKKRLNLYVENSTIYVSDNIGYLYSFNYLNKKINWAQNIKIPFSSNLKIISNKILTSDQNNNLYFFDKGNGQNLKLIPTETVTLKNKFQNNLSITSNNDLLFLNSYGSLYSINLDIMDINWFINLNQSLDLSKTNLFSGSKIINNDLNIVVSSNNNSYIVDSITGSIISKFNFSSIVKPIIQDNVVFFITRNNLLISINLRNNEIIYSLNINQQVAKFLNTRKKNLKFKNFMLLNNELFIFLENSYVLNLNINGELKKVYKLPSKIYTSPIIIDNSILYLNLKNRLILLD